ncbi:MAG: hypothetical protein ACK55A_13895, partial [Gemmatimonas sp.]
MLNGLYTLLSQPFGGALLGGVLLVLGGLVALATRRLGRALRLVALAPALIGVVLTAMGIKGGLDQQRAMAAVPPPGRLVDVGGYRLHLLAEGNARGGATVVWIPGAHEQGNA